MLLKLAAQLAPAYLRIGGTLADRLVFQPDWSYSPVKHKSNMSDGGTCSYESKGCAFRNISFFNMTGMCNCLLMSLSKGIRGALCRPSHIQSVLQEVTGQHWTNLLKLQDLTCCLTWTYCFGMELSGIAPMQECCLNILTDTDSISAGSLEMVPFSVVTEPQHWT